MMTALPTARPAYGLKEPAAARTVDNATPQGSTYLRGNSVQSDGATSGYRQSHARACPAERHAVKRFRGINGTSRLRRVPPFIPRSLD